MMGIIKRSLGLTVVLAAGALTLTAGDAAKPAKTGIPIITDWSSRHVVFSHPRTPEQAARIQNNVRYQMQLHRHDSRAVVAGQVDEYIRTHSQHPRRIRNKRLHRDWSSSLGPSGSVGAANFPAKFGFNSTVATCVGSTNPDFVVFGTGLASSATQASIMALTNLYSGCTGQVPGIYWAYNTGGLINNSPVISFDGTQVAFTQVSGGTSSLVLVKWTGGGSVQTPVPLTAVPAATYAACAALPCMAEFSLGAADSSSSVFYDYESDTAWVGDDSGKLHKFTPVFKGTATNPPAEVLGGGWPATVSGNALTSPVNDTPATNTYVADSGGILYAVSSAGVPTASGRLDFGPGLTEGAILDESSASLYAFSSNDNTGSAGVFQLSKGFASGTTGTEAKIGTASAGTTRQYDGAFDHTYLFSSTNTGNLYVCGNPGGDPTIYQIPMTNGVIGTPLAGPILSTTGGTPCSPTTEVFNSIQTGQGLPQEWVFASVRAAGTNAGCTGVACIMSFRVTQWRPSFNYNRGQEILDSNLNIEVAETSGAGSISGTTPPVWGTHPFDPTVDNGVNWRNQGPVLSFPADPLWTATNPYSGSFEIVDTNNNIEIATPPGGTSGATAPTWALTEGQNTTDGGITWYNLGPSPSFGLAAVGGTSGIIIDNTTNNPGGSQIYYSTLGGGCQPTGSGGCAVQASQSGLN